MISFIKFLEEEANFDPMKRYRRMSMDPAFKILELSNEFAAFPDDMDAEELISRMDQEVARAKNLPKDSVLPRVRGFVADWMGAKNSSLKDRPEELNTELRAMAKSFVDQEKRYLRDPSSTLPPDNFKGEHSPWTISKEYKPTSGSYLKEPTVIDPKFIVSDPTKTQPKKPTRLVATQAKPVEPTISVRIWDPDAKPTIPTKSNLDTILQGEDPFQTSIKNFEKELERLKANKRTAGIVNQALTNVNARKMKAQTPTLSGIGNLTDPVMSAAESAASKVGGKMAGSIVGMWGLADALFGQEAHGGMIPDENLIRWEKEKNAKKISDIINRGYNQSERSGKIRSN
jgi:hypothetical protein